MSTDNQMIQDAIAKFPAEFRMSKCASNFRFCAANSYIVGHGANRRVVLYAERQELDGTWHDYAKGEPRDFRCYIVK